MKNLKKFSYFMFPPSRSSSVSASSRFLLIFGLVLLFRTQVLLVAGSPNKAKVDLQADTVAPNPCKISDNTAICTAASSSRIESTIVVNSTGTHIHSPTSYTEPLQCRFQIPRKDGVCQIRLDFKEFEMAQPSGAADSMGDCVDDVLTITGSDNLKNFQICGKNKNQHLYLHYGYSSMITLTTHLHADKTAVFDILVTFITCTDDESEEAAPAGCTQYFTDSSDLVKSFNYEAFNGTVTDNQAQYQLNNQLYSVCVNAYPGSSEITWQTCKNGAFAISGAFPLLIPAPGQAQGCPTDYIDIPGGSKGPRFCGSTFPSPVTSVIKPFILDVNFNGEEILGPNFEINPATGCCIFCACKDANGLEVVGLCTLPNFCELNDNLKDRVDFNNIGFCLSYTVD